MANPRIEVEIVAIIDGLKKGLVESIGIIGALEKEALELGQALKAATTVPEIANLNAKLAQTKSAITQLKNTGIEPLTKATSQFNVVGLDFARVIQDAPFGIIGVGNNITQLAQSFSGLGQAGDTLSSKFKLALGQIFSSGNALILGVSLLTTAFTILQQKGFFDSEKSAKSLTDRLKEYEETLGSVAKATLKGVQDSEGQLQKFRALTAQAQNLNVSDKDRLAAVNELQKQYPEYLGNLTKEQILTGQVGDSYDVLTKQIIANAKAKAFSDEITKNSSDLRTLEKEQNDTANQILAKRIELQNAQSRSTESALKVSGQLAASDLTVNNLTGELNDLIQKQITSVAEANKIKQSNLELDGLINQELKNGAVFTKANTDAKKDDKKALDDYKASWDQYNLQQETARELQDKLTFSASEYEKQIIKVLKTSKEPIIPIVTGDNAWDQYTFSVYKLEKASFEANKEITQTSQKALEFGERIKGLEGKEIKIKTTIEGFGDEQAAQSPFQIFLDDVAFQLDKLPSLQERVANFAKQTNDLIKGNVTDAFVDLGYTIGETLATGGNLLTAIGGSLLKSFGRFLGQFGQQLIAYGVAASAFGKVSAALANPATAIIAAPLAIAAGIALTAIAGAIGSMGSKGMGGGGGGGGSAGGGGVGTAFSGGGAQGGLFAQNKDLNGELVVRGQDLVYVFGQANNRINKG